MRELDAFASSAYLFSLTPRKVPLRILSCRFVGKYVSYFILGIAELSNRQTQFPLRVDRREYFEN